MAKGEAYRYPEWDLCLVGKLPSTDIASVQSPVTWGTLFGFPDDPWSYSPEFRVAMQKLEAIGIAEVTKKHLYASICICWSGVFHDLKIDGRQDFTKSAHLSWTEFQELFNLSVPFAIQLCASGDSTTTSECWKRQPTCSTSCECLIVSISDMTKWAVIHQVTEAAASTIIADFSLHLNNELMDVGFMINTLLCGRSVKVGAPGRPEVAQSTHRVNFGELRLSCNTIQSSRQMQVDFNSLRVLPAVCSAAAELSSETHLSPLTLYNVKAGQWQWMAYALCCGDSSISVQSLSISGATLTQNDLTAIEEVLRTNYPIPISEKALKFPHQYGFAKFRKGAKLQLSESTGPNCIVQVTSIDFRCRALYNSADESDLVEVIVPGYGVCEAKLGDDVQFTPDAAILSSQKKLFCGSLELSYVVVVNMSLLMDLLGLIASGLRYLNLMESESNVVQLDLTALAASCPELQKLTTQNFTLVASAHNESLQRWPIKTIAMRNTTRVSALVACFKNSTMRMTRELVNLEVRAPRGEEFDKEEGRVLAAYNGQFLPVTKDKLPVEVRTALISVVTNSTGARKAIHRLDAHILSLIFVFASTPVQRLVRLVDWWGYEQEASAINM